ncbi:MAG: Gfo/Idh/MocA family oxidoreductase [Fimbriimonadales bacterium]|nr:Gfo/Idh/MocA family oxidoreductase [Fimbriimonadales bacterium]
MSVYKWGILGTGKIARRFMQAAFYVPEAQVVAVGSRAQSTAEQFGAQFGIPKRYGSYEQLIADPEVQIVYVATPHSLHAENTLAALAAGKHVLCEKPFTLNASQAEQVIQAARASGKFVMEGMWTRCFPVVREIIRRVQAGEIGELRLVMADFGFRPEFDPASRLFAPELGGGALLDVGIYPVALAFLFLGAPAQMVAFGALGATGVDELCSILFFYPSGAQAVLSASLQVNTPKQAYLCGTGGRIFLPAPWWKPSEAYLVRNDGSQEHLLYPYEGDGLQFEIRHVHDCLRQGLTESPWMPLEETLAIMRTLDALRAQIGVRYPAEQQESAEQSR